jgi:hypothetical protein
MEKGTMIYVKATTISGNEFVSEFDRLTGIRELSANVFAGRRPFPVWRTVGRAHPVSNEPCLIRERTFVNGSQILSMEIVEPVMDDHGYLPDYFRPVARMSNGSAGTHRFTEETRPDDAGAHVSTEHDYPLHRAPDGGRFVILQHRDNGDPNTEYRIDPPAPVDAALGAMSEDEWDDEEDL